MLALVPELVRDINLITGTNGDSNPSNFVVVGGTLFFTASDNQNGTELWKSDGTGAGAVLVRDVNPGAASASPRYLTNVNGTLYFQANDGTNGPELWKSDGTDAGTVLVRDIPSEVGTSPRSLTNVNGTLYFAATVENDNELWKSDGTSAGTVRVRDIAPGAFPSVPRYLTNVNGTLYFRATDGISGDELWKSDGTSTGTLLVRDMLPGSSGANPRYLTNVNGRLFFRASNGSSGDELWQSDGTSGGTVMVRDIFAGSISSYPRFYTNVNGTLFFMARDASRGYELWKTDGTSTGTIVVRDIAPGPSTSYPSSLMNVNGTLYFAASNGISGYELWKTDGTSAGTVLVRDILPGSAGAHPSYLMNVNGILYFQANDGSNGFEVWRSDGTSAGTALVRDINPGTGSANPGFLTNVNGTLYFQAYVGSSGRELWKSDGTSMGTVLVRDILPSAIGAYPTSMTNVNGTLYFSANDGSTGFELWKTDGTSAGTALVRDILPGSGNANPHYLMNVNGTLYFQANDGSHGFEVWKSDGTSTGTMLVRDIFPGLNSPTARYLTNVGGTLYFRIDDGSSGVELWKSDGTSEGTILVRDIRPGAGSANPRYLTNLSGTLYFQAGDGINGSELWKSDGTSAGTVLVRDILSGANGANPRHLTNVNGTLYFQAFDGTSGWELWKSNGTSAGTVLVKDINPGASDAYPGYLTNVNGTLYFRAFNGTSGWELWKSDGTSAGTVLVRDIFSGNGSAGPRSLTNVNGSLYFNAFDGTNGTELWRSDGTSAGTVLVRDLLAGPSGSLPASLTNVNGRLFFAASDGVSGMELWSTDGTSAGTVRVSEINPGRGNSNPSNLLNLNGHLFFAADNATAGVELWHLAPEVNVNVSLQILSAMLTENGGVSQVSATLDQASTLDVTVTLGFTGTATNFVDYVASTNTIVILAGQTMGSITLTGIDDFTFEGSESVIVDVTSVTNGTENGTQSMTATISDDDVLPTVTLVLDGSTLAENRGVSIVRASLSNPSTQDVTVTLGFSGNATSSVDYTASSNTIFIPAGQTSSSITLTATDDIVREGNESIVIDINSVTNGTENGTQSVTATIVDDESVPSVTVSAFPSSLIENGGTATVWTTLSNPSTQDVTINLTFSGTATLDSDYSRSGTAITVLAGQTSGSITLTATDDIVREGNESIVIDINSVTNGTENGTQSVTATIVDDESVPSITVSAFPSSLIENGGTATVWTTLSNPSTQDVTINLTFTGTATLDSDYSRSGTAITVLAGQTSGSLTLTGLNDLTFEGNESIVVDITTVTNGTENGVQQVTATLVDDDSTPSVTLTVAGSPLAENGELATVGATLSNPSTQDVTVTLSPTGSATNSVDYSASAFAIIVLAGQTSGSITLTALDDLLLEGDESIVLDVASVLNGTENGTQQVTVTITDDSSDPFQLVDDVLTMFGTSGDDTMMIDYGSSTSSFAATVNGFSLTFSASTIVVDALAGNDSLTVNLSSLADSATLSGLTGSITSSGYAISYSNVETTVLNGGASDRVTYNDPGVVNTAYLLPAYGILQGTGFTNQAIAFGNHTVNAAGNDDNLFIYGDTGVQAYIATPTQARMPVGSQLLIGNNFKRVYAYGMGGNDTATYSGSASDETMTALAFYTFVNTASTVQYFDSFKTLAVAGNGGLDIAVMYDTSGVDTFTASDTSFRYTRSGVFNNIANGYDQVYAFNYFGGFDTATLNGSSGNDRLTSINNYSVLVTPSTLQQATGFRTVIVNAGAGTDTATLQDSAGNDTLNAFAGTAELIYASGRTARAIGFDTVNANGTLGGTNRRTLSSPTYQLKFKGTWV